VIVTAINGRDPGTGDPEHLLGRGAQVRVSGYVITPQQRPGRRFTDAAIGGVRDLDDATRDSPAALWVLGVQAGYPGQAFPTALAHGVTAIPTFIHDTAAGIYRLITVPSAGGITGPQGLSGPVGIAVATATVSQNGFLAPNGLLWWIGFISMNLGLINVLPIPFLDGGKLLFLGVESIRRKRVDPRFEAVASAVGLAVVALLVIYVTIGDVGRLL
jgi:membrane-associated protease RseP (regulator of RpoE activity)